MSRHNDSVRQHVRRPTDVLILTAAIGCVLAAPSIIRAQTAIDTGDVRSRSELAVSLGSMLPVMRTLGDPPSVAQTGELTAVAGAGATMPIMPITPATAWIDVRMFVGQIASIFPLSASYYPEDSILRVQTARAAQWVTRLRASVIPVRGRQLVAFAQLAAEANQDTLARRLFDARLAELTSSRKLLPGERTVPIERSLTLSAAVATFSDPTRDSARVAANLPIAHAYATTLAAIPLKGYGTVSDSTIVLYRQFDAAVALARASNAVHATTDVLAQSSRILSLIPAFGLNERFDLLSRVYPYREVATILAAQPNGRARLDSLNARMLVLAAPRDAEFPAAMPAQRREELRQQSRGAVQERIASFALIGKAAPPIAAHAWLNTPDSEYSPTPRTQRWNDGILRVLVFGGREQNNIVILQRIQQHFPTGVQPLFITSTQGSAGPDIKTPADEVEWLRHFYRDIRHVTVPIALWAGAKVPGPLNTSRPAQSTVDDDYYLGALQNACVIVGGDGIVRGYEPLQTRDDEARLIDRLTRLRASVSSSPTPSAIPSP